MKSPITGNEMRTMTYEGVTIDVCPDTGGVWLDDGELQKIVATREEDFDPAEMAKLADLKRQPGVPAEELAHQRFCPKDGARMQPVNYGGDTGLIIDKCPECGGIWLDKGELEKIQMIVEQFDDQRQSDLKRFAFDLRATETHVDAAETSTVADASFGGLSRFLRRIF